MHHDVRFETGDSGEPFLTHGAGGLDRAVGRLVQHEVELHVVRLGTLVTAVRLQHTGRHTEPGKDGGKDRQMGKYTQSERCTDKYMTLFALACLLIYMFVTCLRG